MLKSCTYCGRIHDKKYICPQKKEALKKRQVKKKQGVSDFFHSSAKWTRKSKAIRERDHHLCQACLHGIDGAGIRYTHDGLEVHHIVPISEDYDLRLDDDNLITLCRKRPEDRQVAGGQSEDRNGPLSLPGIQSPVRHCQEADEGRRRHDLL